MEKREPSCPVGGNVNWCSHYGKQCEVSSKSCLDFFAAFLLTQDPRGFWITAHDGPNSQILSPVTVDRPLETPVRKGVQLGTDPRAPCRCTQTPAPVPTLPGTPHPLPVPRPHLAGMP